MNVGPMLYGAALSVVAAVLLVVFVGRTRQPWILGTAAAAACLMPICWNLILRWAGATDASPMTCRCGCSR